MPRPIVLRGRRLREAVAFYVRAHLGQGCTAGDVEFYVDEERDAAVAIIGDKPDLNGEVRLCHTLPPQ